MYCAVSGTVQVHQTQFPGSPKDIVALAEDPVTVTDEPVKEMLLLKSSLGGGGGAGKATLKSTGAETVTSPVSSTARAVIWKSFG